jgi:hypothetical protein
MKNVYSEDGTWYIAMKDKDHDAALYMLEFIKETGFISNFEHIVCVKTESRRYRLTLNEDKTNTTN